MTKQTGQELQVSLFREAGPYIHKHRNKTFVIAFSGDVIEQEGFRRLIQDIAIVAALGVHIVIIHGSRPQIEQRLKKSSYKAEFHNKVRITNQNTLKIVQEACGFLRIKIENLFSSVLNQPLIHSAGLSIVSGNFLSARSLGVHDGIDYQHTGKVRRVDTAGIKQQLHSGNIVLLSPIASSPAGDSYNLSHEETAIKVASSLQADKVIFLTPCNSTLPSSLTLDKITSLTSIVDQSLLLLIYQKLVDHEIERAHIIDSNISGALLLELHTREGLGCMLSREEAEAIRPAELNDIPAILDLIRPLEQKGILVRRSREQLEADINNFHVAEVDQQIIGCVALYTYEGIAELACLAVEHQYRSAMRGDKLLQYIETLSIQLNIFELLVLTTQTVDWFKERGFEQRSFDSLPENKQVLYNYKRNSKVLIKEL